MKYRIKDYSNFTSIINIMIDNSKYFSLCYRKRNSDLVSEFRKSMKRFSISEYDIYKFNLPKYHSGQKIVVYELNDITKKIIIKSKSFDSWNAISLPEDICFYYNRNVWTNYISHEKYLFVDFPNNEIKKKFDNLNIDYIPIFR